LALVEKADLAENYVLAMGKRNARYKDSRIGMMSETSQRWIDRNFALDYVLKSIIKITNKKSGRMVFALRAKLKEYSYSLLAKMLSLAANEISFSIPWVISKDDELSDLMARWNSEASDESRRLIHGELLNHHFQRLKEDFRILLRSIEDGIDPVQFRLIQSQVEQWLNRRDWELINKN
jgi:hypothetical protein